MDNLIVIISYEEKTVFLVRFSLVGEGFNIKSAPDGISGLKMIKEDIPEMVILDQVLPDLDGYEVCKEIRKDPRTSHIPIIIIIDKEEDKYNGILALEIGADNFIVKPFSSREILGKVKALLRLTSRMKNAKAIFLYKGILVDTFACIVKDRDREVELTAKEFGLLVSLLRDKGNVLTRKAILRDVWGLSRSITPRTVDNHISNLRKKIPALGELIITVKQFGYKLKDE